MNQIAYPVLVETRLLIPVAQATVPVRTKPFSAAMFYSPTSLESRIFNDTFADRFDLHARQTVDSAPTRPYVAFLLKENAYNKDIRKELPEMHLSTLEDIAGLIEAQPEGKSGFLLNNGNANIFYVEGKNDEVFAIRVDCNWDAGDYLWWILDCQLVEDFRWYAEYQFLCPGTAVL